MRKDHEVIQLEFDDLWVISRLFAHIDWKKIAGLEDHFKTKVLINPLFDDKVSINVVNGILTNFIDSPRKRTIFKDFHLHFEKWNSRLHCHPRFIKGYGGWISIEVYP